MAVPPARIPRTLLTFLVLTAPLLVFATLWERGTDAWLDYGVEPITPAFSDMRAVTTAADCDRKGIDPLRTNPCHPYQLPAPYPRVWVTLTTALGISERHTALMAGLVAAAFLAGVWSLLRLQSVVDAIVWMVVVCSPPVLLAAERGSLDFAAFGLLAAAVVAVRRVRRPALVWVGWTAAVLAKLFPLFAAPAFLFSGTRRQRQVGVVAIALVGAWFVLTLDDIRTIYRVVPQGIRESFGARVIFAHLANDVVTPDQRTWGFVLAAAAVLVVVLMVRSTGPVPASHLPAFHAGALLYAATFMLGSNWEYRLIFLLFALPQLLEWAREGAAGVRAQSAATLGLIVAVLWLGQRGRVDELADDVVSWALLLCLAGLVRLTMPAVTVDRLLRRGRSKSVPAAPSPSGVRR
jgi:hypothetical protein